MMYKITTTFLIFIGLTLFIPNHGDPYKMGHLHGRTHDPTVRVLSYVDSLWAADRLLSDCEFDSISTIIKANMSGLNGFEGEYESWLLKNQVRAGAYRSKEKNNP